MDSLLFKKEHILADIMKKLVIGISISMSIWCAFAYAQNSLPVLLITPGQLVNSGDLFQGMRVKMELVFAYKASIQADSSYQKCSMEGKFRETHRKEDEYILYEIYIPNTLFVQNFSNMVEGKHLTIIGTVENANGSFSKILTEEIKPGWSSDTISVIKDTLSRETETSADSITSGVKAGVDSLRSKLDSLIKHSAVDSMSRKSERDSSWIK